MGRHFDDWIENYLEFCENSESPQIYHQWIAVSTIAAVLKRKVWLQWHTKIYPNMYIVLVGPPGCRKGTAMGPAQSMLEDLNINLAAEAITREALIRVLKDSNESVMQPDGTVKQHCSLTVFSPELSVFLGQNNIQLLSDLCDWFDCRRRWEYRTKNMGVDIIQGVWVNLLGATTPTILRSTITQDAIGGGLTSRIIFIYAGGKGKIVPYPFPTEEEVQMRELLIQDLEQIGMLQGQFSMSPELFELWADWYNNHEANPPFDDNIFLGYNERKPIHTLKLCMIMCAARTDNRVILPQDLERASKFLRSAEAKMPEVFSGYGRRENADLIPAIKNLIATAGQIPRNKILNQFLTELTKTQMDEILYTLESIGFCKLEIRGKDMVVTYIRGSNQD